MLFIYLCIVYFQLPMLLRFCSACPKLLGSSSNRCPETLCTNSSSNNNSRASLTSTPAIPLLMMSLKLSHQTSIFPLTSMISMGCLLSTTLVVFLRILMDFHLRATMGFTLRVSLLMAAMFRHFSKSISN